uniref:Armadillo repeat-containing protein 6 n=1 Tax=Aegilops tauschii subsp. strangulata TaxID=200361 RepID=A0A453PLN2_AEGTS
MAIAISQEAFDDMVRENMEDLGMDPDEALADAVDALTLQGANLSGIIRRVPGDAAAEEVNPVMRLLDELKASSSGRSGEDLDRLVSLLDELLELCSGEGAENAAVAARNGGVEALVSLCASAGVTQEGLLASGLKALSSLIRDVGSTEKFRQSQGPKIVMDILKGALENSDILDGGFSVVAMASAGNEVVKDAFMDLKVDELILEVMRNKSNSKVQSVYDAIRVLLTPDDNRVVASQEEICRSISENGGIDVLLKCIDEAGVQKNKVIAKSCCSLLSKLAGSDANKANIIQQDGFDKFLKLASRFSEDPSVIQEVMSIVQVLTLRSPEHAARAVALGYGNLAIQTMQKFPSSALTQKQACLMIRNLVVRNPENRTILLNEGVEKLIRKAKAIHGSCKAAATDALRDLGLDNYNA